MFLLKCPKCGNKMKYQQKGIFPKIKKCVYCGKSFNSKDCVVKKL